MKKIAIIRKMPGSGKYRLYSKEKNEAGERKNLGTYTSRDAAKKRDEQIRKVKHMADDGEQYTNDTKALSKMSDMAGYLEEAGYIDAADKVYMAMAVFDGMYDRDEDNLVDSYVQMNPDGPSSPMAGGSVGGGAPSWAADAPTIASLAKLADNLDKTKRYKDADEVDNIMMGVIEQLEEGSETKVDNEEELQDAEVVARSNGKQPGGVEMASGISDANYTPYGAFEGKLGPAN